MSTHSDNSIRPNERSLLNSNALFCRGYFNRGLGRSIHKLMVCLVLAFVASVGSSTAMAQILKVPELQENLKGPLIDKEPFDLIYLDKENWNAVLKIRPLRKPPVKPYPDQGVLIFEFADDSEQPMQVLYDAIESFKTFNQLLVDEADAFMAKEEYPKAFRNLLFVYDNGGKRDPTIVDSLQKCLFLDGKDNFVNGRFELALSIYEDIYATDPDFDVVGINRTLPDIIMRCYSGVLAKKFEEREYDAIRESLKLIQKKYGDQAAPLIKEWNTKFESKSDALIAQARKLLEGDDGKLAHQAVRRATNIVPDRPEAIKLQEDTIKRFPIVFVAIDQGAGDANPNQMDNWGSRRVGRLTQRSIVEFAGLTDEGGKYNFLPGSIKQIDQAGMEYQFTIESEKFDRFGVPPTESFLVSDRIRTIAEEDSSEYNRGWAKILENIEIVDDKNFIVRLKFPFVRPESLLSIPFSAQGFDGQRNQNGAYYLTSVDKEYSIFAPNPIYKPVEGRQHPLLIEQFFDSSSEAVDALLKGDVDLVDRVPLGDLPKLKRHPKIRVQPYTIPTVHMLVPNGKSENEFVHNTHFRLGLLRGIDRDNLLNDSLLRGQVIDGCEVISGPFPIGSDDNDQISYGYNMQVRAMPYNSRLAMVLVTVAHATRVDALRRKGVENPVVEIPPLILAHPDNHTANVAAAAIQRRWLELPNVQVRLRKLDPNQTIPPDDDWDFLYLEANVEEPLVDAPRLLGETGFATKIDATTEQTLIKLSQAGSWRGSCRLLRDLHRQVSNEVAVLPLYQIREHYAYRRNLKDVGSRLVHLYENIERWRIDSTLDDEEN